MSLVQNPSFFKSKAPQIALILITIIWGGSFLTVQYGLNFSSPIMFVAFRFMAAAIAVSLISWKYLKDFNPQEFIAGALIGLVIAIGYGTQTIGLKTISSSESAFLTALYVPLVPILLWLIFRQKPYIMTWLGISLAFIGLILLTGNGFSQIHLNYGQILTIIGSVAIALEIILIGYYAGKVNVRRVTIIQLAFATLFCFILTPFIGEFQLPNFQWQLIAVLCCLGIASACIQLVMNWAQQSVDSTQAAIIYAGEPVWAAIFGRIAGERLPFVALFGGLLVVLGVIVSEWKPKFLQKIKLQNDQST